MEKVSIIMGIYNCSDTLRESIDSIIAQTYTMWELIMCDDASTDNTYEIAKQYVDMYPQKMVLLRNQSNSKLSATLNHCLQYATGNYVARMDGDDISGVMRLEKQVKYLQEHPDVQLIGCAMQAFDKNGMTTIRKYKPMPDKFVLRIGPCFAHATIMTYKHIYDSLGGYAVSRRTQRSQDYDLWFRFYAAGYQGANLSEVLYFVREDEDTLKRRKTKVYLWAIVTRWIGFRKLRFPLHYYVYVLKPAVALFKRR